MHVGKMLMKPILRVAIFYFAFLSMSYSAFAELQCSTSVSDTTHATLTSAHARNLIVARGNTLEIYDIPSHVNNEHSGVAAEPTATVFSHGKWLKLVGSYSMYGTILSVRAVRPNQVIAARWVNIYTVCCWYHPCSQHVLFITCRNNIIPNTDILIVSFPTAKMSVLAFDYTHISLRTLDIYNFEEGALGPGKIFPPLLPVEVFLNFRYITIYI